MKPIVITIDPNKVLPIAAVVIGIIINICMGVFALSGVNRQHSHSSKESNLVAQANQDDLLMFRSEFGTSKQYDADSQEEVVSIEKSPMEEKVEDKTTTDKPNEVKPAETKTTNVSPSSTTTTKPATAQPIAVSSTTKSEPWPEHVDANGDCLPTHLQVDTNGNFYPTCSSPIESVQPNIDNSITYTYSDYEKTILGTCPSERKNSSWEEGNRLNAIGIITSGENPTSPIYSLNHHIETWWNSYRKGTLPNKTYLGRYMMANLTDISGFDNTWSNTRIAMYIDFNGFFVNWDNSWEDGKSISASEAQVRQLDQMASDGTNYLRWLENAYNTKCPND